ncbi:class I SAM-dependent methyltransferase [Leucothrix pacifica]|uniref:Methyltransferase type 11 domain-containing protein n=1 Tax=Leucothrix pacifica TaxID=1247513 RepID=A0A317C0L8_9GAMM|nr:class I SAM-dependent methyltransferase [Leucothrix pacifica]PWQ92196.1 hypothetical protein DKW60_22285 [Leucothrix pacifica]
MKDDHRWLEPYSEMLQGKKVLELGCGSGIDTKVITKLTEHLVSGDLAPRINGTSTVLSLDHSKPLPFQSGSFDVVVASLCLHYFSLEKTKQIILELSRVLKPQGKMLCRVNSYRDENYGAMGYSAIEPGLYDVNGDQKRFFKKQEIQLLWSPEFTLDEIAHRAIDRYQKTKYVYEFSATKA